jgi:hypothetical protein
MTIPEIPPEIPSPPPAPPTTTGAAPRTADEVNGIIGLHLRQFKTLKSIIANDQDWLVATDLKVPPYNFSADQETLIKSAIGGLDAAFDSVEMTFINRLVGMFGTL